MNNLTNLLATGCSEAHILTHRIGSTCRTVYGEASKSAENVATQRKERPRPEAIISWLSGSHCQIDAGLFGTLSMTGA